MDANQFLEKLLNSYRDNFDIERNYTIGDYTYDALGRFDYLGLKYVLIKKAEIWRANCFEYILFDVVDSITEEHLNRIEKHIREYVEPKLVRKGEKYPIQNHMYSYMTVILISRNKIDESAKEVIKRINLHINYKFTLRGYSVLRLACVDMMHGEIVTNKAAKLFIKELKKLF